MSYGWRTIATEMVELCDECGFDGRTIDHPGPAVTAAIAMLDGLTAHVDAARRPDAETYSADEYALHSVEVTTGVLGLIAEATGRPLTGSATDLAGCAEVASSVIDGLTVDDRARVLSGVYPFDATVGWLEQHLLHDLEHHVLDVRRGYARLALADHRSGQTIER